MTSENNDLNEVTIDLMPESGAVPMPSPSPKNSLCPKLKKGSLLILLLMVTQNI